MRKYRCTLNELSPENVKNIFINTFSYNSENGEITHIRKNRLYQRLSIKGYRQAIYLLVNSIEYRTTYHRLCWFLYHKTLVPDNIQIDHIDRVKSNNCISNLRLATLHENAQNKRLRKDNKTGYIGVMIVKNVTKYATYFYFTAIINNTGIPSKIARCKNPEHAAVFYDSAARFYYGDFAICNFDIEYLKPMSVADLRIYKRAKKPLPEMVEKITG